MIAEYNSPQDPPPGGGGDDGDESSVTENSGTVILDATCAPQNISFPQNINLLNEARENLESMIDTVCYEYNYYRPRMYRGIARLEKLSFDAYNECDVLIGTIENYRERTGHYPERVLVDQIYRNRENRAYCKEHGIRISGPVLGRRKQLSANEKETGICR